MNNESLVKDYLREVSENLACSRSKKKYILNGLETLVSDYANEHPDCTMDDIKAEFGEPRTIQNELETKDEYVELAKKAKKRTAVLVAIIVALAIAVALAVWLICTLMFFFGGTFTVSDAHTEFRSTFLPAALNALARLIR